MATENPLRLIRGGGAGSWLVNKDSAIFSTSSSNLAADELGLLLEGQRYHGNMNVTGPSRSGSAPPSMEGSRAAFDLLKSRQSSKIDDSLETLAYAAKNCTNEEQLRGHPAYLAYYCANVNLNPRLPPPLISRENRDLVNHISGHGDHWEMSSFDDRSKGSLFVSRPPLSTHKEEPEDDKSPRIQSVEANVNVNSQPMLKGLMNSLQEDYPSSSFPVYDDHSRPSDHIAEKDAHALGAKSDVDVAVVSVPLSTYPDKIMGLNPGLNAEPSSRNLHNNSSQLSAVSDLNVEIDMKNLRLSDGSYRNQHGRHLPQQVVMTPQSSLSQPQMGHSQLVLQGGHNPQNSVELFSHSQPKSSSVDVPVLQSSSINPSFYAAANTYGTPYYSSLQPANLFPPQFGISGYALNASVVPPVLTRYPHHSAIPLPIENPVNPSFAARASGVPSAGNFIPGVDLQQFYKIYGQLGMPVQPSFSDQLYMPFFQQPSVDIYSTGAQYDSMIARGNIIGSPSLNYDPQKGAMPSACLPERPLFPSIGVGSTLSSRKGNSVSANYHGNAPNLGVMQYPNFPVTSPVFQESPASSTSFSGRRNDNMRYSPGSGRNARSGWQGPRGRERLEDPKSNSFLEELKSSKARRYELSDIIGRIVEFSSDQHGSRFIQQKLESCNAEEKELVFNEVLMHAPALMIDVFGNYVIQKFFEHGSPEQRKELANKLVGNMLPLSLQMYGCRVIQKALEVIELDQKTKLVQELDGNVLRCVHDQNGNHVIQKCIECVPAEKIGFIISSFRGHVATLSMHPYGCRVIQRVLEHCTDESQSQCIVDEILQSACILAQDQYGNYVTQHVLERGRPHERSQIISKLAGQIVQMSQHKFASNVIEKCLVYGDASEKDHLIEEIVDQTEGNDSLLMMMKDQFANYVVQKILETCSDKQREILLGRIKVHLHALKKYTYGKHIVARVEQLCGEDGQSSES